MIDNIREELERSGIIRIDNFLLPKDFLFLKKSLKKCKLATYSDPITAQYSFASFDVDEVQGFISLLLGKDSAYEIREFKQGDYTLLNDEQAFLPGYDIYLDITPSWDTPWGGSLMYVDGEGGYMELPPAENALYIVKRQKKLHAFLKYVNNHAGKHKRILLVGSTD